MTFSFRRFWRLSSIFVVGAFIGVDVFAMTTAGVDATFSRYVLGAAQENPVIPLAAGVVLGHLFWPQPKHDQAQLDQDT